MRTAAYNSTTCDHNEVAEAYRPTRTEKEAMFYRKVSKVLKNPKAEARRLRAQMSKEVYPFITVNQLDRQRKLAVEEGDDQRAEQIVSFLEEMIRQEMEDGFPGTVAECLTYLRLNVSVGRLYAANIEAVYRQYVKDLSEDPFIHLPKVRKALAISSDLASESIGHAYVCQKMEEMVGYVVGNERKLGYEGSDVDLLEAIHAWELQ